MKYSYSVQYSSMWLHVTTDKLWKSQSEKLSHECSADRSTHNMQQQSSQLLHSHTLICANSTQHPWIRCMVIIRAGKPSRNSILCVCVYLCMWVGDDVGMLASPSPLPPSAGYLSEYVTSAGTKGWGDSPVTAAVYVWACVSGWLIAPRYNGPDSPSSTPRHSSRPLIPLTAPPRRGTGTPKNIQWGATKHTITLDVPSYYAPASILSVFISLWIFLTLLPSSRVIFSPSLHPSISLTSPSLPILASGPCLATLRGPGNMD